MEYLTFRLLVPYSNVSETTAVHHSPGQHGHGKSNALKVVSGAAVC